MACEGVCPPKAGRSRRGQHPIVCPNASHSFRWFFPLMDKQYLQLRTMKHNTQSGCPVVHLATGGELCDAVVPVLLEKWREQMHGRLWWTSGEYFLFLLRLCHSVESSMHAFVFSKHSFGIINALQEKKSVDSVVVLLLSDLSKARRVWQTHLKFIFHKAP